MIACRRAARRFAVARLIADVSIRGRLSRGGQLSAVGGRWSVGMNAQGTASAGGKLIIEFREINPGKKCDRPNWRLRSGNAEYIKASQSWAKVGRLTRNTASCSPYTWTAVRTGLCSATRRTCRAGTATTAGGVPIISPLRDTQFDMLFAFGSAIGVPQKDDIRCGHVQCEPCDLPCDRCCRDTLSMSPSIIAD